MQVALPFEAGSFSGRKLGVAMADFDKEEHNREYPREILHTDAEIKIDGHWHDCKIINISSTGVKLNLAQKTSRVMDVFVKVGEFGPFHATVVWSKNGEAGVKFDHDPSEMTLVLMELEKLGRE
jgi:hypothetical protein